MSAVVTVAKPGFLTTVQDIGRLGFADIGVARSGAMNPGAARIANALLGNGTTAAVLELSLNGPILSFDRPITVAVTGAPIAFHWQNSETRIHLPMCRPVHLPAGTLTFGRMHFGARSWLAFGGGIAVPDVLGSASTDLRAQFGGMEGRPLQRGDSFAVGAAAATELPVFPDWWVDASLDDNIVGAIRFVARGAGAALDGAYLSVDRRSNRQGIRMEPEVPLDVNGLMFDRLSEPVCAGVIQCPPDGNPIVLGADAQTVGGYPVLGFVIEQDLERLAQVKGGERVQLVSIPQAEADAIAVSHHRLRRRLLRAIADRL